MKAVVPIHRLRGSVLGLVGFGRIPARGTQAQSFGMKVLAFDPFVPADVFTRGRGARRVPGTAPPLRLRVRAHAARAGDARALQPDTFGR